jgi:formylglycine-generating enzyme required for sulfatase activity
MPGSDRVTLSWDSVGSGVSYKVYHSTNPSGVTLSSNVAAGTSMNIGGLVGGTSYYFWVSTVKDGQESGKSPVVTVRTAAVPVTPVPSDMVRVSGGTFTMGSPSNEANRDNGEAQHQVTISAAFYIGKSEVTQKEWVAVMGSNPSSFKGDNLPVEQVSWYDAIEYCNKRRLKEGLTPAYTVSGTTVTWNREANGYRLPTEAEWEYAARGGSGAAYRIYAGSNSVDSVGWWGSNSGNKTHPAGTKGANSLGIHDMSGNVYEWCWDWYASYGISSQTDPRGASSGSARVARGGSWDSLGPYLRSASRDSTAPSRRGSNLGFRLVRSAL